MEQIEKRVREHAGDKESAWEEAGKSVGIQIWRIEKFKVVPWPKENYGTFYSGDSYIILSVRNELVLFFKKNNGFYDKQTFKKDPNSDDLFYNLHFWLGDETTQDEAGTATYKTVELDDRE